MGHLLVDDPGFLQHEHRLVAREGLEDCDIDRSDIDHYLGVLEDRVTHRRTGARWMLESLGNMDEQGTAVPAAQLLALHGNYPNPFNPSTEISFAVPAGGANVSLRIYDVTGRMIRTLADGFESAGTRTVTSKLHDASAGRLPPEKLRLVVPVSDEPAPHEEVSGSGASAASASARARRKWESLPRPV